jgi:hypothetical protein
MPGFGPTELPPLDSAHIIQVALTPIFLLSGIAALLNANRSALVRQSVVGSGASPQQAEAQLSLNMVLLQHLDRVRFSLSATPDGHRAEAELRLK